MVPDRDHIGTMPAPQPAQKTKTIAVNPLLHRYLKLLTALDGGGLNELTEPALWDIVRANRERLEQLTGEAVNVPDTAQAALPLEGVRS